MNAKTNQAKYTDLACRLHTCENDYESAILVEGLSELLLADEEVTIDQSSSLWYQPDSREHGVVDLFHTDGNVRIGLDGTLYHFPNEAVPPVKIVTASVDPHELARLQECENAWNAVYEQLLSFNPEFCQGPRRTGKELALIEIMRLQLCAHHHRKQA